jgi:hypothetical protein
MDDGPCEGDTAYANILRYVNKRKFAATFKRKRDVRVVCRRDVAHFLTTVSPVEQERGWCCSSVRQSLTTRSSRSPAGVNEVVFDASNLASGVYACHLEAGEYTRVRKMTVLR